MSNAFYLCMVQSVIIVNCSGLSQLTEAQRVALTAQTEVNKQSDDADPLRGIDSEMDTEEKNADDDKNTIKTDDTIKKGIMKPVQLNSDVTILPTSKVRKSICF